MKRSEQIQQAIQELEASFEKLNNLWKDAEDDQSEALAEGYPFHKDFNELVMDIKEWTNYIE